MMHDLTINMMVKNEERYIRQTLRSVLPHVEQAIIIDTGSTDNTAQMIFDELKPYGSKFEFEVRPVTGDSINWNGNHLSKALTDMRNMMLERTATKWVWQVDGDEIYTEHAITDLEIGMSCLRGMGSHSLRGIQVPIKWCTSDYMYAIPGPFPKTLRVMPKAGKWIGEFPNEFLYVDGIPMVMHDPRCITTSNPFLHMSIALHPERRPANGVFANLSTQEQKCLNI
jgi:glycosyltransferase involved in cell wall biosynthesis